MPSDWNAIAAVADARDATESLLRPVDRGRWLRLAVVALFVGVGGGVPFNGGGGTGVPSGGGDVPAGGVDVPATPPSSVPDGSLVGVVLALVAVVLLLALAWSVVGAVMEFVLVAGLRDREVRLRRPFRDNLGRGLWLFGFRVAVGLTALLAVGGPVLAVVALGVAVSPALFLLVVPLVFLALGVALVAAVALRLTTDFVVPVMLTDRTGVRDGWRRLLPTLRAEWKQVVVYVVARFVLGFAVGIAVTLATLVGALVLAVPFAVVGAAVFAVAAVAGAGSATVVVLAPLAVLYALAAAVLALVVQVPAVTFVRYYSLSVLGRLAPAFDLVGVGSTDPGSDGADAASGDAD